MFKYAIVRKPGPDFSNGLTTANLGMPSYPLMVQQHQAYIDALRLLGLKVIILDALPNYPDAYFVEDVAIVTPEMAVLTNPGAETRRGEVAHIASALRKHRSIAQIQSPGTLDGGDIMMVGKHGYIGISARTNEAGAVQLERLLEPYGYQWTRVSVGYGLHLKSSVNYIGQNTLLLTGSFAEREAFNGFNKIVVDDAESYAANTLLVNDSLLTPTRFLRTKEKLVTAGFAVIELDTSEIQKMDGGLSCMSLRF